MVNRKKHNIVKSDNGFTLIELMIVMAIMASLAAIAFANFMPMKQRAYDATAITDSRNLADSVVEATLNGDDVDFTAVSGTGGVGAEDTSNVARQPIYLLSNGIKWTVLNGSTNEAPHGNTYFEAIIYHVNGTDDPDTVSGKREFRCVVDESSGVITYPNF